MRGQSRLRATVLHLGSTLAERINASQHQFRFRPEKLKAHDMYAYARSLLTHPTVVGGRTRCCV